MHENLSTVMITSSLLFLINETGYLIRDVRAEAEERVDYLNIGTECDRL